MNAVARWALSPSLAVCAHPAQARPGRALRCGMGRHAAAIAPDPIPGFSVHCASRARVRDRRARRGFA